MICKPLSKSRGNNESKEEAGLIRRSARLRHTNIPQELHHLRWIHFRCRTHLGRDPGCKAVGISADLAQGVATHEVMSETRCEGIAGSYRIDDLHGKTRMTDALIFGDQ